MGSNAGFSENYSESMKILVENCGVDIGVALTVGLKSGNIEAAKSFIEMRGQEAISLYVNQWEGNNLLASASINS